MTKVELSQEQKELILARYNENPSIRKIQEETGLGFRPIKRLLKESGVAIVASQYLKGTESPFFKKNSEYITKSGYVMIRLERDDDMYSMANHNNYVFKHRIVMARHLGRALESYETVHHIDGNRQNNSIDNLQLRKGPHGRGASFTCLDCGSHNVVAERLKVE